MRVAGRFFLFVIFVLGANSCFDPPVFSNTPNITNPVLTYYPDPNLLNDSVTLVIDFADGDGDLGLDANAEGDNEGVFANKYYFNLDGQKIDFGGNVPSSIYFFNTGRPGNGTLPNDTLITFQTKRTAANDTFPDFVPPYECTRWSVISNNDGVDTIYVQLNPNNYNMFVDIYVKDPSTKVFNLFDFGSAFNSPSCFPQGFHSRFPILSNDLSKPAPLEGKITYGMVSSSWGYYFNDVVLQLHIQIQDRALHKSNVLITNPFTLDDIKKN